MTKPMPTMSLPNFGRRGLLKGALAGGLAAAGAGAISSCGGGGGGGGASTSEVTLGVYQGDEVPRKAMQTMIDGYDKAADVKINFVDHETFKTNINN